MEANLLDAAAGAAGHLEAAAGAEAPSAAEESSSSPLLHLQAPTGTDGDGVAGAWHHLAVEAVVADLEFPFPPYLPYLLPAAEGEQPCCLELESVALEAVCPLMSVYLVQLLRCWLLERVGRCLQVLLQAQADRLSACSPSSS